MKTNPDNTVSLKRCAVYDVVEDDGTVEAQKKLARMSVDE